MPRYLGNMALRPTWVAGQTNLGVDTPARGCYTASIVKQKRGQNVYSFNTGFRKLRSTL